MQELKFCVTKLGGEQLNSKGELGYPRRLIKIATVTKSVLQMVIAAYAVGWLIWSFILSNRIRDCVTPQYRVTGAHQQFCYFIPPANIAFQIIASALAAATVIELAYTLFTPGPDEALDPVLLAIASALLFQLGKVDTFHWQDGLTVLLYAIALGALFVVRVFIAPDKDNPPRLWWWLLRHPSSASNLTVGELAGPGPGRGDAQPDSAAAAGEAAGGG